MLGGTENAERGLEAIEGGRVMHGREAAIEHMAKYLASTDSQSAWTVAKQLAVIYEQRVGLQRETGTTSAHTRWERWATPIEIQEPATGA